MPLLLLRQQIAQLTRLGTLGRRSISGVLPIIVCIDRRRRPSYILRHVWTARVEFRLARHLAQMAACVSARHVCACPAAVLTRW